MKVFLDLYNKLFKKEIVKVLGENNTTFADKYSSSWVHEDYTDALKMLKKIKKNAQNLSQEMLEKIVIDLLYFNNHKKTTLYGVRHFTLNYRQEQDKDINLIKESASVLHYIVCLDNTFPFPLNILDTISEKNSLELLAYYEVMEQRPLFEKGVSVWQKILTEKHFNNSYKKYFEKLEEYPQPSSYFMETMFSENENGTCLFEQFLRLCPKPQEDGSGISTYVLDDFVQTYLNLSDPSNSMVWRNLNPLRDVLRVLSENEYMAYSCEIDPTFVALKNFEERLSVYAMQEQLTKVVDSVNCSQISSKKRKM